MLCRHEAPGNCAPVAATGRTALAGRFFHRGARMGRIASAAILTYLPEIGTLDRRQVGSLAGVVPYNRDSGQWKGKSFISGGRKPLRDALYMPALVAMRYNPDLKVKYEALRAAGKPAKVAIVAIMRKLIETANALVKANRRWVQKTA